MDKLTFRRYRRAVKRAAEDDDIEMGDVSMGLKCPVSDLLVDVSRSQY